MRTLAVLLVLGMALWAAPLKPVGNLLVNGSFEEGSEAVDNYKPLDKDSEAIKGWKVTRGQIDWIGTFFPAADGKRCVDLHGSPGYGGVSQAFKTKKGKVYVVELQLSSTPGAGVRGIVIGAAGDKKEFEADPKDGTPTKLVWSKVKWEFTAVGDETTLEIYTTEKGDSAQGPIIDDVSVREK